MVSLHLCGQDVFNGSLPDGFTQGVPHLEKHPEAESNCWPALILRLQPFSSANLLSENASCEESEKLCCLCWRTELTALLLTDIQEMQVEHCLCECRKLPVGRS